MKKIKNKKNNVKNFMQKCIHIIALICIIYNVVFLLNTAIFQNKYLKLYGFSIFCMENDSMKNEINKNDFVLVKEVKRHDIQEGDIIAYKINNNIRINKVINKNILFTTKSNNNYYPDYEKVPIENIIGKKIITVPYLGKIIKILQSKVISVLILIILIFKFSYNKRIYTKRKKRKIKITKEVIGNE